MKGNQGKRGARPKNSRIKKPSGAKRNRGKVVRGATPKATDRTYHKAYKAQSDYQEVASSYDLSIANYKINYNNLVFGKNPVAEVLGSDFQVKEIFIEESILSNASGQVNKTTLSEHKVDSGNALDSNRIYNSSNLLNRLLRFSLEHNIRLHGVDRPTLNEICQGGLHQGYAVEISPFQYVELDQLLERIKAETQPILLVMLDHIQDPRNLGSIIRSALGLGARAVIIPNRRSACITPTVWKTSAGAVAKMPIVQVTNLSASLNKCVNQRFFSVGLDSKASQHISHVVSNHDRLLVVLGGEEKGISRLLSQQLDYLACIPMSDKIDSLNASVAASILFYEFSKKNSFPK